MRLPALFIANLLLAGAAVAQQTPPPGDALQRRLEMPAHERLMRLIATAGTELAPFTTDGCSGGMSASWTAASSLFPGLTQSAAPPWEECCVVHDHAYHDAGGARTALQSYDARLAADEALQACVIASGQAQAVELAAQYDLTPDEVIRGHKVVAGAMFNAVRLGGGPCTFLPWRWGYGYPGCPW